MLPSISNPQQNTAVQTNASKRPYESVANIIASKYYSHKKHIHNLLKKKNDSKYYYFKGQFNDSEVEYHVLDSENQGYVIRNTEHSESNVTRKF